MKIYFDKIHKIRKNKGFSVEGLCKVAGISRATLWKWEKSIQSPLETNIKNLASALGVAVNEISDLEDILPMGNIKFDKTVEAWEQIAGLSDELQESKYNKLLQGLNSLNGDVKRAKIIINALKTSMDIIFYIKDVNQKYIIASDLFIKKLGLNKNFKVLGMSDEDLLSLKEARYNKEQDKGVLTFGNSIINEEGHIPGTRKKEWGLISKHPIRDNENKIVGLIGVIVNITDRKKLELRREMLETLLDAAPTSIFAREFDKEEFWYVNKTIESQTGYSKEQFYKGGRKFYSSLTDGRYVKKYEDYNFSSSVQFSEEEIKFSEKHHKVIPMLMRFPEKNKDNHWWWREEMQGFMEINNKMHKLFYHRDCTFDKQTQLEGIAKNKIIESLVDDKKIIFTCELEPDNKLSVTYLNGNFERILGYKNNEFCEKHNIYYPNFAITYPLKPRIIKEKKKDILNILAEDDQTRIKEMLNNKTYSKYLEVKVITADDRILCLQCRIKREICRGLKTVIWGLCEVVKK